VSQLKLSTQTWSTQTAFILAAVGAAVGLGNLWKFPYITGENGGGAFVLVYLGCVLLIGLPILMAEISLGRVGQASPPQAMANVAREAKASKAWTLLGLNGVLAGLLILSFYTVIAGWALAYFIDSLSGDFIHITAKESKAHYAALMASPYQLILWDSMIMLLTILIVSKGVKSGLEKSITFMMPALFLILFVLLGYAATTSAFGQSFHFLFDANFSKLSWNSVLIALGHAFFTLSLGIGTMMVYGSYMPKNYSIVKASLWIVFADTAIALIAGLIIFSIVFDNGLNAGSGPGLLFQTLPIAFGKMSGGWFFGSLFFFMVVIAAVSSSISMLEPTISWMEQNWGMVRSKASWVIGGLAWVVGLGTVFSFNIWKEVHFIGDKTFFNSLDFLTANIQLPLGGLFMALFVGWVWSKAERDQFVGMPHQWSSIFGVVLKYIAPILVSIVFVLDLMS